MGNKLKMTLAAAIIVMTGASAFAYDTVTTTTRNENGVITSVNYSTPTPWFTVRNTNGVENKVYIDNDNSRGWTRVQGWNDHFVTGTPVRYQYEDRNHNWYARDVYIADDGSGKPFGWSQGKKTGWKGSDTPPGRGRDK